MEDKRILSDIRYWSAEYKEYLTGKVLAFKTGYVLVRSGSAIETVGVVNFDGIA